MSASERKAYTVDYKRLNWDMVIECDEAIDRVMMHKLERVFDTSPGCFGDYTVNRILSAFEDAAKCRQFTYRVYMQQNPGQKEVRICNACGELMVGDNFGGDFTGEDWHYECHSCGCNEYLHFKR